MANVKFQNGSVISYSLIDDDVNDIYRITATTDGSVNNTIAVYPLDTNIKRIPIIGESILIVTTDTAETFGGILKTRHYYMNPTGVHNNIHSNALPDAKTLLIDDTSDTYSDSSAGNPNSSGASDSESELGEGFEERDDVGSLQPFLGDVMIEGRFGHSLRFGNTPDSAGGTHNPSWSGDTSNDPITILSNGRVGGAYNKFIIEDVQSDLSSIWLTSSQKVKLSTSNTLPKDIDDQSNFDLPSVILNSDRIILNSKSDYVILSGAKSVAIATPEWAMDMDKMFTILEELIQQVADLTSGTATFATGVGPTGPATNVADLQSLLIDLQMMAGGENAGDGSSAAAALWAGGESPSTAEDSTEEETEDEEEDPIEDPEHAAVPHFPVSSMTISSAGVDFIKLKEGFEDHAYQDSVGVWTIGYGTTAAALGREIGHNETITAAKATQYLLEHLEKSYTKTVKRYVKSTVTQGEFDAMVSFVYNLGSGNFSTSTLLKKFNSGDHFGASMEFLKWDKAGGKQLAGLTKRRKEEQDIFLA